MKEAAKAIVPLVLGLALLLVPTPDCLSVNAWRYFALFVAVIAALVLETMPPGAVGLIGLTVAGLLGLSTQTRRSR